MNAGNADSHDGRSLVVTGSSAGGIEALSAIVDGLRDDFPAPIVVAQHLDPHLQSRLGEILSSRTALPVRVVENDEALRPGTIYVVPAGHDVEIADDHVRVQTSEAPRRSKPSVDRLFRTAAKAYGERLIAVILSGMGSDGVAGAREVKRYGGTVVIQEPSSASYPSMPLALAPTLVDFSVKPENIGPLLRDLLTQHYLPDGSSENALRTLLMQIRDRSGIDFLQYKTPTIRRRLGRLMAAAGIETFDNYIRYLQHNPEAYQRLVSAFLIKVTEFFRDPQLFDFLRDQLLPLLIDEARARDHELRLWSAGCATGEEAYSLAIMVAELLRDEADGFIVRIFATDLDADAVAFARRGIYTRDALENVPEELIQRYFTPVGDAYEVGKRIRNMTVFGQHDLGQRAPFPRIDLVLCRNVLIYFTKELQHHALQLFAFSLRTGGYLVLGKAETTSPAPELFKSIHTLLKIFQRQGERVLIPASRIKESFAGGSPHPPKRVAVQMPPGSSRTAEGRSTSMELLGSLIFGSPIGVVIVDRRYDIVTINRVARTLLNVHGVGVGEDLIHLATSVEASVLREIIDAALRNESVDVERQLAVQTAYGGAERYLRILAFPDKSSSTTARVESVILVIVDVSEESRHRRELERINREQEAQLALLTAKVEELTQRQRQLLEANDELTTANLELRSGNEQLLISLEETASSTEEVETLNEEMQATNEELETLNEELQATVEELNTTNDELEARGRDLEELGRSREATLFESERERRYLASALHGLSEPIAILAENGSLLYRNAALDTLLTSLTVQTERQTVGLNGNWNLLIGAGAAHPVRVEAIDKQGEVREFGVETRRLESDGTAWWLVILQAAPKR